ncbi:MAG: cytochrome c maturation protein CcmE [Chloroflexi bacterium]|nr:cytochrome c maturation protein CcmE [Chloroflexota bacterium]
MSADTNVQSTNPARGKFLFGGLVILSAVVYLIVSSTLTGAQFFLTVEELIERSDSLLGKPIQVTGAVIEDTIEYDAENLILKFTIVHMPADNALLNEEGGLADALHAAVEDESRQRLEIVYYGVKPDLLQHEAQAIMSGTLGDDGLFYADELLLKCPTRYEEALPEQSDA